MPKIDKPTDPAEQVFPPEAETFNWREEAARLDYEEKKERRVLSDEKKRMEEAVRQQGRDAMVRQRAMEIEKQRQCAHMKPLNGGSAVAGQRDHKNVYHWICQYCSKEWTGNDLPTNLRIDLALVGGPTF